MTSPQTVRLPDDGVIPNSRLPLLVYRNVLPLMPALDLAQAPSRASTHPSPRDPAAAERIFAANQWSNAWRNGIYTFHHFHSTAHEVLGVARGEVSVLFGGPRGQTLTVTAGDVVVVPAGVGHCNQGQTDDLLIIGAYPENAAFPDLRRGDPAEYQTAIRAIAAVPLPLADPVHGHDGPLTKLWA